MEQITLTPEQVRSAIFRFADNNKLTIRGPHKPVKLQRFGLEPDRRYWHFQFGVQESGVEDIYLYVGYIMRFMAGLYPGRTVHMATVPIDFDHAIHVYIETVES
jgi:hypothetical protein